MKIGDYGASLTWTVPLVPWPSRFLLVLCFSMLLLLIHAESHGQTPWFMRGLVPERENSAKLQIEAELASASEQLMESESWQNPYKAGTTDSCMEHGLARTGLRSRTDLQYCQVQFKNPTSTTPATATNQTGKSAHSLYSSQDIPQDPDYYKFCNHFKRECKGFVGDIIQDYKNYYTWETGLKLLVAIGVAAPFANTSLDMDFYHWYEDNVRSSTTDNIASFWKFFGEGVYMASITCGVTLMALMMNEKAGWLDQVGGEYCKNVFRAYLVGAPPVFFLQHLLGGDRPDSGHTYWRAFDSNHAVSGHAFTGAVPFIMAAKMSDALWLKVVFYACSFMPAWSRINDGAHSLSQAGLGWYMAYIACDSVMMTEMNPDRRVVFAPVLAPNIVGGYCVMKF